MTVNCSKCGKPLAVTVFKSVNSDYADDLAMQIMSGELFNVKCPHCQFVSHLEYDFLYHDMKNGAMIWVVHKNSPNYASKISEVRATQKLPYKTLRIVEDMNALKEKVSCLEQKRDDRIVELCKVFTANNLLSQHPDFEFRNAFYTAISGKDMIYLYDNDGNDMCCELPEKAYDYLKELYENSPFVARFDDNYAIVDYAWAEAILQSLVAELEKNDAAKEEKPAEPETIVESKSKVICPKCKSQLPEDSEFCQRCGTKLSLTAAPTHVQPDDKTEELLSEFEIMEVKGSHPVIIQSAHLFCSADREKYYLRCNFKSLSDKVISALMVDVFCFDVWGNELPTIRDAQVLDLSPKRDEMFGFSRKIPIVDANTRTVHVKLKRIRFEDGTIENCSGEEVKLPTVVPLSEYFDSLELMQQYIYETSKKSSLVPAQIGEFWMCSCGKINTNTENVCTSCGINKQIVFDALDGEFLEERYATYIEHKRIEEENLKRERERQRIIEQQKQEELKRQRNAEIQNERNLAILKRIAATEAENKKKKIIKIIIICVVAVLVAVGIIISVIGNVHNGELRNFATETMSDDYTNVYADVILMEPVYFVYTSYNNGPYSISEIVCKCVTVEGKTIWAAIDIWEYPGGSSTSEEKNEAQYYSKSNSKRIVGKVTSSGNIMDELEKKIGDILVLSVTEKISQ